MRGQSNVALYRAVPVSQSSHRGICSAGSASISLGSAAGGVYEGESARGSLRKEAAWFGKGTIVLLAMLR